MRKLFSKDDLELGKVYGIIGFKGVNRIKIIYFDDNDTEVRFEVIDDSCAKGLRTGFNQCHIEEKLYQLTTEKYDKN